MTFACVPLAWASIWWERLSRLEFRSGSPKLDRYTLGKCVDSFNRFLFRKTTSLSSLHTNLTMIGLGLPWMDFPILCTAWQRIWVFSMSISLVMMSKIISLQFSLGRSGTFLNIKFSLREYHPASRASFISFCCNSNYTEKEALHKSSLSFEVAVAPILWLVIPVYRGQTCFSSASINFYEKPMVKTEPTASK